MIPIQEVTKQTGITVRTLRYYDEIGLLPPAGKSEGNHRLYGENELKKLQEIQFLKKLGFQLNEIKEMLSNPNWNWAEGLEKQLNYIVKQKEKISEIERILKGLINGLTIDGDIDLIHIQKLIQLYQNDADRRGEFRSELFNEKERELLALLPNVNSRDPDSLEWVALVAQLKQQMKKGTKAPEIQRIIRRIHEKITETYGSNEAFFEKVWAVRTSPEQSEKIGFYPLDKEFLDFFEEAWEVFQKTKK